MRRSAVRLPAVSGLFYEAEPARLRHQVASCFTHPVGPGRLPSPWGTRRVVALVVPHAALRFSGPVAAHAYLRMGEGREPTVVVIVGPDHHGFGPPAATTTSARWTTPLGEMTTDHPVRAALVRLGLPADDRGHAREHAVEVQLPFLQTLGYRGAVVPIAMAEQDEDTVRGLVALLGRAAESHEVSLIASTDLSHYLSHDAAVAADRVILDALATGDGLGLLQVVRKRGFSMCGAGPAAVVLEAARRMGGGRPEVLRYATSGEVSGDRSAVVGYAAAVLEAA